jgi:hypothetical protein
MDIFIFYAILSSKSEKITLKTPLTRAIVSGIDSVISEREKALVRAQEAIVSAGK